MSLKLMDNTINKLSVLNKLKIIYALVGIGSLISVFAIRSTIIAQDAVSKVNFSQVTLNLVIMFGFWGYFTEWYAKKKKWGKKKSAIFYVIGTLAFFTLLRVAGLKTIFG
jgi:hypothetical protein